MTFGPFFSGRQRTRPIVTLNDRRQARRVQQHTRQFPDFLYGQIPKILSTDKAGDGIKPPPATDNLLLDFDFGAGFFQFFLGGVRISFVSTFEQGLRSTFHEGFGFREAETGLYFTDNLDDSNLLVSGN
jgi:hypothetical protein